MISALVLVAIVFNMNVFVSIAQTTVNTPEEATHAICLIYCAECKDEEGKKVIDEYKKCLSEKCEGTKQLEEVVACEKSKESVESCVANVQEFLINYKNTTEPHADVSSCDEYLHTNENSVAKCDF